MEELNINPYQVCALTQQLCKEGPAILASDKRNKNGFIAFQFCYYRKFQLLSDEEKEQYVGGSVQTVTNRTTANAESSRRY